MIYDLVIIGSGAAGLSAALYARRYNMNTLVFEGEFGGETATAGKIENYPGIMAIDGYDLMKAMKEQGKALGVQFTEGRVQKIERQGMDFLVKGRSGSEEPSGSKREQEAVQAKTVIIAIGSQRRHLNLPKEQELTGRGVHYCVTCDGPIFSGKTVAMVGGGDSSVKGVNFLGEYAKKIYFIVRGKAIIAEPINFGNMKKLGDKVEMLLETEVKELIGDKQLEKIILSKAYKGSAELVLDGMFVEIGYDPDQTFVQQLGLQTDEAGYTKVDNMMRTNIPGIFSAGDSTNHFGRFKQDITAAALGAVAATSAYEYNTTYGQ
ncbi:MAG: FAD-dependent oxidoreductase [Candidatus Wildermuthbacteria bacterium]|nr:FAD-dependent oxidoreductase [Candidatus Wildermuthbacteria bacterium]